MATMMRATTAGTAVNRTARTSTDSNQLTSIGETITVTAAQLTLNALFGNIRVPKGAEIAFVQFYSTDLDSSTGAVFTMGDTGDDDRLMTANTGAQTGAVPYMGIAATGFGYKYTDETLVQLKLTTAPSGTAAAGTIKYIVHYVSQ